MIDVSLLLLLPVGLAFCVIQMRSVDHLFSFVPPEVEKVFCVIQMRSVDHLFSFIPPEVEKVVIPIQSL